MSRFWRRWGLELAVVGIAIGGIALALFSEAHEWEAWREIGGALVSGAILGQILLLAQERLDRQREHRAGLRAETAAARQMFQERCFAARKTAFDLHGRVLQLGRTRSLEDLDRVATGILNLLQPLWDFHYEVMNLAIEADVLDLQPIDRFHVAKVMEAISLSTEYAHYVRQAGVSEQALGVAPRYLSIVNNGLLDAERGLGRLARGSATPGLQWSAARLKAFDQSTSPDPSVDM